MTEKFKILFANSARLATFLVFLTFFSGASYGQQKSKFPSHQVRETQQLLVDLGYRKQTPTGNWDQTTSNEFYFFYIDQRVNWFEPGHLDLPLALLRDAKLGKSRAIRGPDVLIAVNHGFERSFRDASEIAVSGDGRRAVSVNGKTAKIWDLERGKQVASLEFRCCVTTADLSHDGSRLLINWGTTVRLWDFAERRYLASVFLGDVGHSSRDVLRVRLRPTTTEAVIADNRGIVALVDLATSREVAVLGSHETDKARGDNYREIAALAVSKDGRFAASIGRGDGVLKIWNIAQRKLMHSLPVIDSNKINFISRKAKAFFSEDSLSVVTFNADASDAYKVDVQSGKRTNLPLETEIVDAYLEGNTLTVVGTGKSRALLQADIASGVIKSRIDLDDKYGRFIATSLKNDILLSWDFEGLKIFNLRQNSQLSVAEPIAEPKRVSVCSSDRFVQVENGDFHHRPSLTLWDVREGKGIRHDALPDFKVSNPQLHVGPCLDNMDQTHVAYTEVSNSKWTAHLTKLALADDGEINSSPTLSLPNAEVKGFHILDKGQKALLSVGEGICDPKTKCVGDNPEYSPALALWDLNNRRLLWRAPLPRLTTEDTFIQRMAGIVAYSSRKNHGAMATTADGRWLVASREEWKAGLWDLSQGKMVRTFDTLLDRDRYLSWMRLNDSYKDPEAMSRAGAREASRVQALAISRQTNKLVIAVRGNGETLPGKHGYALLYDLERSSPEQVMATTEPPNAVAVDSRAQRIATGGRNTGTIDLITVGSSGAPARLIGHQGYVIGLQFSPDGNRLYSISSDRTFRIWDTTRGELLVTAISYEDGEWIMLTPEGFFSGSPGIGSRISVKTGPLETASIDQLFQSLYRPDLVREKLAGDPRDLVKQAAKRLDVNTVLRSGKAPGVRMLPLPASINASEVKVDAEIDKDDGGVGQIEWRVNGVVVAIEPPGALAPSGRLPTRTLTLDEGESEIELIAYNAANLIASKPAKVTVKSLQPGDRTPGRLHVLAIGVNDYEEASLKLAHAVSDAEAVTTALGKAGSGHYSEVQATVIKDKDVTRERLAAAFESLAGTVQSRDVFVLFIAGHGKTIDGRYHFIPANFRAAGLHITEDDIKRDGIDQTQWQQWLSRIASKRSLLLFDTCESGTLTDDQRETELLARTAASGRLAQAVGRTILTATSGDADAFEGHNGHGLFTYNFLAALQEADADRNGTVEVAEIATYMYANVLTLSQQLFKQRQAPQVHLAGNYSIVLTERVLSDEKPERAIEQKHDRKLAKEMELLVIPALGARRVRTLPAGAPVSIARADTGWLLVTDQGRPLGYAVARDFSAAP